MDDLIAYLSPVDALLHKLFSLGKGAGFSGLDLCKDNLIHFSFGKPVKDNKIHRSSEESSVLGVIFEVREIRDKVFRDLASDYGFTFFHCILADFFSSSSFHVLKRVSTLSET